MREFPPNINPELFTLTAIIVGLVIEDDFTASELNAIGNWLILVGQIVLTTASEKQLINNRIHSIYNNQNTTQNLKVLINEIESLRKEIDELKKDSHPYLV